LNLKRKNNLIYSLFLLAFLYPINLAADTIACMKCHGEKKEENIKALEFSVHKSLNCIQCHGKLEYPHNNVQPAGCSECHSAEFNEYSTSSHGIRVSSGASDAPDCIACHGKHDIKKINKLSIPARCFSCHTDSELEEKYKLPGVEFIKAYTFSIHGKATSIMGLINAPVCSDCHSAHAVLPPDNPSSKINKANIPNLCGKCHTNEKIEYMESVHGSGMQKNISESPVCTNCHGEHTIYVVTDPNSNVSPKNLPKTCSNCHDRVLFVEKFGFKTKRMTTYMNTFHGVANVYGDTTVANCASCHGYHSILPSTDPRSNTHPDNIPKTCGKCHPNAGINFAKGQIHVEATPEVSKAVYFIRTFYKWFIGILCVLFIIHIMTDYSGHRRRKKSFAKEIKIDEDEKS